MDPTALLDEIRELINTFWNYDGDDDRLPELSISIVEKIENLDNWLSDAGFFPEQWMILRNMLRS